MIIDYIYIERYGEIVKNINLNFGGPIHYECKSNIVSGSKNKFYIDKFYRDKTCIEQISAIVGKNSSGKTTILRVINSLFSNLELDFSYVIIYRNENCTFYDSNMSKIKIKVKETNKMKYRKINDTKIIYFSNIFDKSNKIFWHNNLEDISSNSLLRDYVNSYYNNKIESLEYNNNLEERLEKIKKKDTDIINDFRKSESLLKLRYFKEVSRLPDNSEFKSLFGSPQFINISYADDSIYKIDKFLEIERYIKEARLSNKIYTNLIEIEGIVEEIIEKTNEYLSQDELKRKYKNEFLGMLIFEFFSWLILVYNVDILEYTDIFLDLLYKNEDDEYDIEKIFYQLIEKVQNNEYILLGAYYSNYEIDNNIEIYNDDIFLNKFEFIYDGNSKIIELIEDYDVQNNIEFIQEILEKIKSINEIDLQNIYNITDKFLGENEIYKESISEIIEDIINVNHIKNNNEVDYSIGEGNNIEIILSKLKFIYKNIIYEFNNGNYSEQICEEKLEEYANKIEYINSSILDIIEKIRERNLEVDVKDDQLEVKDIPDFVRGEVENDLKGDLDSDVITFSSNIDYLIEEKMKLINDNDITVDQHNILNLRAKWNSDDAINFISLFEKYDFESFDLVYDHEELSSGQNAYLDMMSRMLDIRKRLILSNDIIMLIDEGDVNLHPEVQAAFINNIILFLHEFFSKKRIHVILTTNSPFIISDMPHSNIIYLEREQEIKVSSKRISNVKTFGTNINELLINSFYMEEGLIGSFSQKRINYIIECLSQGKKNKEEASFVRKNIELIGDCLLRSKLKEMYIDIYGIDEEEIYSEINYYKKILLELEAKLKHD